MPTEKERRDDDPVELTPPAGFGDRLVLPRARLAAQDRRQSGSGEDAEIRKVTWSGGERADRRGGASSSSATRSRRSYDFKVRQTYSDGTVVDWTGPRERHARAARRGQDVAWAAGRHATLAIDRA